MLTETQLKGWMKHHLRSFARAKEITTSVSDNTVHNTILSDSDGFGHSNSKMIYKAVIKYHLSDNGNLLKLWPVTWMEMSVSTLANKII